MDEEDPIMICPECGTELFRGDKAFFAYEKLVGCYMCTHEYSVVEEVEEEDFGAAVDDAWAHRNDPINDIYNDAH